MVKTNPLIITAVQQRPCKNLIKTAFVMNQVELIIGTRDNAEPLSKYAVEALLY